MGTCPGSMCHSARWHSATFRRHEIKRIKALGTKKYCEGGKEYSGIFNFKFRLKSEYFSEIQKDGHFDKKRRKKQNNDKYCGKRSHKRQKIRSLLSWQQHTIRLLAVEIGGEGSFSGEEIFHVTLQCHKLEEIRTLSQEDYGSGGLVPQRLFYVKGLYKTTFVATWMS